MKIMLEDNSLVKFENDERPFQGIWSVRSENRSIGNYGETCVSTFQM